MIVIGVDVHKYSLTAVAVDEVGRTLAELTASDEQALLAWSISLPIERLWAVEDCRHVTRALEKGARFGERAAGAGAAEADRAAAALRPRARRVRRDRCARDREGRAARTGLGPASCGRGAAARAEATARSP